MVKTAIISCVAVVIASCGSKSSDKTLENSKGLLAMTTQVVNGDTLVGVRTIFDTIQVVPMAAWDSIRAISPEVVTAYKEGAMYAYTSRGYQLGKESLSEILTVTTSLADSTTFYRGVEADNKSVFYFPASNSIIDAVCDMYIGRTVMLFATSNGWDVRSYDGALLWQVDDKECVILRRIFAEEETIQIAKLTKAGAEIYDTKGNLVAEVSKAEWVKATKSFRRTAKIGNAGYGELDVNYQF